MKDNIIIIGGFSILAIIAVVLTIKTATAHESDPYFVVTQMVQCRGSICNAVLEMDDIAILVPYDSNNVHVGDTLYLTK